MNKSFRLDFVLYAPGSSLQALKDALECCGESLKIFEADKNFMIQLRTQEPTLIFDICTQHGKISSVKVNEEGD